MPAKQGLKSGAKPAAQKLPSPKVLFVGTECSPFSKVGGLGDIMGSLPKALLKRGIDVRVVTPAWPGVMQAIKDAGYKVDTYQPKVSASYAWAVADATVHRINSDGVTVYFLESDYYAGEMYHGRSILGLYVLL